MIRDLPNLQSITLGGYVFRFSPSTIIENLPSLQSITLDYYALYGRDDDSCSLTMRNLPNLTSINSEGPGDSFCCPRLVTLENIPNLRNVRLPGDRYDRPFRYVRSKSISNVSSILADLVEINSYSDSGSDSDW